LVVATGRLRRIELDRLLLLLELLDETRPVNGGRNPAADAGKPPGPVGNPNRLLELLWPAPPPVSPAGRNNRGQCGLS
jgi:hypothetical protein